MRHKASSCDAGLIGLSAVCLLLAGRPNVDCSGRFKPKILKNGVLVPQESAEWDCEYAHTLLELMYHPQVRRRSSWLCLSASAACLHSARSLMPCVFFSCLLAFSSLQVYKTGLCDHFDSNNPLSWRCVWKRRCAHSHGEQDVRTKEEATEGTLAKVCP